MKHATLKSLKTQPVKGEPLRRKKTGIFARRAAAQGLCAQDGRLENTVRGVSRVLLIRPAQQGTGSAAAAMTPGIRRPPQRRCRRGPTARRTLVKAPYPDSVFAPAFCTCSTARRKQTQSPNAYDISLESARFSKNYSFKFKKFQLFINF